jgi:nucleotide-binding universal stress UspA family protein
MDEDATPARAKGVEQIQKVVVGVDGSEPSLRALRWAARQATWTAAPLEVVTAWTFPDQPAPLDVPVHVENLDRLVEEAQVKLDQIVADEVPTQQRKRTNAKVVRGNAVQVLLDEASDAALLVVGSSGRGAVQKFLLGSVSERCIRRQPCPVTVVP